MFLACRLFAFLVWFALFVCGTFAGKLDKPIAKFTGKNKCLRFSKEILKKPGKADRDTDTVDVGRGRPGWTEAGGTARSPEVFARRSPAPDPGPRLGCRVPPCKAGGVRPPHLSSSGAASVLGLARGLLRLPDGRTGPSPHRPPTAGVGDARQRMSDAIRCHPVDKKLSGRGPGREGPEGWAWGACGPGKPGVWARPPASPQTLPSLRPAPSRPP